MFKLFRIINHMRYIFLYAYIVKTFYYNMSKKCFFKSNYIYESAIFMNILRINAQYKCKSFKVQMCTNIIYTKISHPNAFLFYKSMRANNSSVILFISHNILHFTYVYTGTCEEKKMLKYILHVYML